MMSPGFPDPEKSVFSPEITVARTMSPGIPPSAWTVTPAEESPGSGVIRMSVMCEEGRGSSQTVCHIPVLDVYQIPSGDRTCFPRGWSPASVGSYTPTISSCCFPGRR